MAGALARLGVDRALLVSSADGLDEMSTSGETHVVEVNGTAIERYTGTPEVLGLPVAAPGAVAGGTPQENAAATRSILTGEQGPRRDIAVLNGGAAIYAAACASCHDDSQPLPFGGMALPRSMGVAGESPLNLMNVILYGLPPAAGATAPIMPGFDGALGDAQIVELAAWMRARFTRKGPWPDLEGALRKARRHGAEGSRYAAGGNGLDPAAVREKR
jgi:mono/diheme cytochrome c family protein